MAEAFVYILTHTSGSTVKVGETTVSPNSRLQNYSKIYALKGFSLHKAFKVPLEARKDVERRVHQILQKYQLSGLAGAREIFSCTTEVAERAIETAIEKSEAVKRAKEVEIVRKREKLKRKKEIEVAQWEFEESKEYIRFQEIVRERFVLGEKLDGLKFKLDLFGYDINPWERVLWFVPFSLAILGVYALIDEGFGDYHPVVGIFVILFMCLMTYFTIYAFSDGHPIHLFSKDRFFEDKREEISSLTEIISRLDTEKGEILLHFFYDQSIQTAVEAKLIEKILAPE